MIAMDFVIQGNGVGVVAEFTRRDRHVRHAILAVNTLPPVNGCAGVGVFRRKSRKGAAVIIDADYLNGAWRCVGDIQVIRSLIDTGQVEVNVPFLR